MSTLLFEFKSVGLRWGVFESVRKNNTTIAVGCVFIGTAPECRAYVAQREAKKALQDEERSITSPAVKRYDRLQGRSLFAKCLGEY